MQLDYWAKQSMNFLWTKLYFHMNIYKNDLATLLVLYRMCQICSYIINVWYALQQLVLVSERVS